MRESAGRGRADRSVTVVRQMVTMGSTSPRPRSATRQSPSSAKHSSIGCCCVSWNTRLNICAPPHPRPARSPGRPAGAPGGARARLPGAARSPHGVPAQQRRSDRCQARPGQGMQDERRRAGRMVCGPGGRARAAPGCLSCRRQSRRCRRGPSRRRGPAGPAAAGSGTAGCTPCCPCHSWPGLRKGARAARISSAAHALCHQRTTHAGRLGS